jgi:hypothetical protein
MKNLGIMRTCEVGCETLSRKVLLSNSWCRVGAASGRGRGG